jgi:hypothetical protein
MEADELIESIRAAFPLEPLPEMSLRQAWLSDQTMDREIGEEEWAAAGKADEGRSWEQFSDEELMSREEALAHLEEPAFVYYLPAFLSFTVRHCSAGLSDPAEPLVGSTVFSVTHLSPYSLGRYKRLNDCQQAVVVAFLEFVAAYGNPYQRATANEGLSRYWKTDEVFKPLIVVP